LDQFAQAAEYIDRILKGAKLTDLPVQAPTKYELVNNLPWPPHERSISQAGTWRSSSATQQGSSVVEGAADQKTMLDHGSPLVCN